MARPVLATEFEDLSGASALPRSNGELVFSEPWEARAFGMVVAMYEAGHFQWDDFRDRLIARIAAAADQDGSDYYEHWLAAFEDLMTSRGVLTDETIGARVVAIAAADRHDSESG